MNAQWSKSTSLLAAQTVVVLTVLTGGVAAAVWDPHEPAAAGVSGAEARTLVAQAASRITTVGSYRMTFTLEIAVHGGKKVKTTGTSLVDTRRNVQRGQFDVPGFGSVAFRQLGGQGYFGLPNGRVDAAGHHWIGVPGGDSAAAVGAQDPLQLLRALDSAAHVTNEGAERVAGVATVRYSAQPDPQRMIAAAEAHGTLYTPVPQGVAEQFTDARADLWLDQQQLPRRFRMNIATAQVSVRFQFDFADYGGSIDVQPPPMDDVTQATTVQQAIFLLPSAFRS